MNEDDIITRENSDTLPPQDKRREKRLHYESTCFLQVHSPAWAMTRDPLAGLTRNITENGMRVDLPQISRRQFEVWKEASGAETPVRIEVDLPKVPEVSPLRGNMVWLIPMDDVKPPDGGGEERMACSVGILFAIMAEDRIRALRELIASLTTK